MKLKHAYLAGLITAILATPAMAVDNSDLLSSDGQITLSDIQSRSSSSARTLSKTIGAPLEKEVTESTSLIEMVAFYQNSYAAEYNAYEAIHHIEEMVGSINEAYETNNIDAAIVLKDIVPITSVPDDVGYSDITDEEGNITKDGAGYLTSIAILNEGYPEYDIYQSWQADLVMSVRDNRSDSTANGAASVGGEYSIIMADNDELDFITTIHEVGHNLGARHEIEDKPDVTPAYAHSSVCDGTPTVMKSSLSSAGKHKFYSSPEIVRGTDICGDADNADNARVVEENNSIAAARRDGIATLGTVNLDAATYSVFEDETLTVSLTRDGDLSEAATVKVFAVNGTAEWGKDFSDVYQIATFAPNSSMASVSFTMVNDTLEEDEETFTLELKYPYTLSIGDNSKATVYLSNVNNSGDAGSFSVSAPTYINEGNTAEVTITRSANSENDIVINVFTTQTETNSDSSAAVNEDFLAINQKLHFVEGETSKTLNLVTWNDSFSERTETFVLNVSSDADTPIDSETTVIAIRDTTEPTSGTFTVNSISSVTEGGDYAIDVNRTDGYEGDVTLTFTTAYSNGLSGASYELQVSDQDSTGTISFTLPDNSKDEDNYTMSIAISADTPDALISDDSITVSVIDNDQSESVESGSSSSGGGSFGWLLMLAGALLTFRKTR